MFFPLGRQRFFVSAFQRFSFQRFLPLPVVHYHVRLSSELRQRTKRYASSVIGLYVSLPKGREEVRVLGKQLLRSGTSVAGHSREASRARSDAEFCSKLDGLLQETDESGLWLELLQEDCAIFGERIERLMAETNELLSIFATIVAKVRKRGS